MRIYIETYETVQPSILYMCVCIYTDPIPFPSFFFFGLCLGLTMGFINAHSHGLARQLALCPHPSLTSTPRPHSVAIVFYTISI